MQILGRITGKSFYVPNHTAGYMSTDDKVSDTKKRAEDWWNDFQKNGEFAMLAAGTEAGDNNSPEQAARLLRRFPKQALPTIEKAIQRATNGWIRPRLVQVLADDSSSAAIKILQREAVAGLDVSRAAAADILLQNGWTNIVDTMVNVWMTNADYFPENDSGLLEVPKFLVRSDSPQAIAALCENLSKRPLSSRMALVEIVGHGGTSYGEIRSLQERAAAAHPAMEHFLVKTLADDGRQFRPGGNDLDPRVGDTAAVFLHRFWPERYEFDASAPIEKRNQQRVVCQNVWRKAHGQTELPLPSSKRVKPTEAVMNKVSVVQWLPGSMKPSPGIAQCITNFTNANLSATNFAAVLSEFFNNPPLDASGLEIELERNPDFPGVKMFINLMPGHLLKKRESVLAIHSVSLAGAGLSFGNHEINREMYFMSPDWDGFISAVGEVFSAPAEKPFKVRWRICPEMSF